MNIRPQDLWVVTWALALIVIDSIRAALRRCWLPITLIGIEVVLIATWQLQVWGPNEFSPLETGFLYGWLLGSLFATWAWHYRPEWRTRTYWSVRAAPALQFVQQQWRRTEPVRQQLRSHQRKIELALATGLMSVIAVRLELPQWCFAVLVTPWLIAGARRRVRATQNLWQRITTWLQANRGPMSRIFKAWAFGLLSYTLLVRYEPRLENLLDNGRVFAAVMLWPALLWTIWLTRRLWLWPLGLSPCQPLRQRRWQRVPALLPSWNWTPIRPYWIGVAMTGIWIALKFWDNLWPKAFWFEFGLLWAATFVYITLQPAKPSTRQGHTLAAAIRPHGNPATFLKILFKYGLFSPIPKMSGKDGKLAWALDLPHLITKFFHYFCGLGPLGYGGTTLVVLTILGTPLSVAWSSKAWLVGFGLSWIYWGLFAISGWRKVLYWVTDAPDNAGEIAVTVPRLRPWGLVSETDTALRNILPTSKRRVVFGNIVDVDPGGELTIAGENIVMYGVDERKFPL